MLRKFCLFLAVAAMLALAGTSTPRALAAITPKGQQGCANGAVVGGPNLIVNGDFSQGSTAFQSDLPDRGPGVYPSDPMGGFSIQTGQVIYFDNNIVGRPFPGDSEREISVTNTYFYSNPNQDKLGNPGPFKGVLWRQTVTNLAPNTTYNFFGYFDNLQVPGAFGVDPQIELRVDGIAAGPAIEVPKLPDTWIPIQYLFTTGANQTSAVVEVYDLANNINGDDFGMTQLGLKQCVSGVGIAKYATTPTSNPDGSYDVKFTLTVRNTGTDALPLTNVQVNDDLNQTFPGVTSLQVLSISSPTLTVNSGYNGTTDTGLLASGNSLASRVDHVIQFTVRVVPGANLGPFYNTASVTATAGNIAVNDNSVPGSDPDPNGNGASNEPNEDRPTVISFEQIRLFLPLVANPL